MIGSTLYKSKLQWPSHTLAHARAHTQVSYTCSLRYWIQSLPVLAWSTTTPSRFFPNTLATATLYLCMRVNSTGSYTIYGYTECGLIPWVYWFTQLHHFAVLQGKGSVAHTHPLHAHTHIHTHYTHTPTHIHTHYTHTPTTHTHTHYMHTHTHYTTRTHPHTYTHSPLQDRASSDSPVSQYSSGDA